VAEGRTEICAPAVFTRTGVWSDGYVLNVWGLLLANGFWMKVERKAPVATKPKAIAAMPSIRFIGMLLSLVKKLDSFKSQAVSETQKWEAFLCREVARELERSGNHFRPFLAGTEL